MPQAELQAMAKEVDMTRLMKPQQIVEVVQELNPAEREELTQQLVEAKIVPEEQRAALEATVKPGGYADQFAQLMRFGESAYGHAKVIVAVPVAGLLLSFLFDLLSCDVPLQGWLRFSSLQWLGMCGCIFVMGSFLAPGYRRFKADPIGVLQRWHQAPDGYDFQNDLEVRCQEAIPELPWANVVISVVFLLGFATLLVLSIVWAAVALIELLSTAFLGCNGLVTLITFAFMVMHVGVLAGAAWLVACVAQEVMHQRRNLHGAPMREDSQIPMAEDALPRVPAVQSYANSPTGRGM